MRRKTGGWKWKIFGAARDLNAHISIFREFNRNQR